MPVVETVVATLAVAFISIALAAYLSFRVLGAFVNRMVSFSIGILLATAFLHLIPEAFESSASLRQLCAVMLAGLFGFFLLEKIAVYRHSHHFEGDGHQHAHGHDADEAGRGGIERMQALIPYVLVVAAANFIYISLSDLVRLNGLSSAARQRVTDLGAKRSHSPGYGEHLQRRAGACWCERA